MEFRHRKGIALCAASAICRGGRRMEPMGRGSGSRGGTPTDPTSPPPRGRSLRGPRVSMIDLHVPMIELHVPMIDLHVPMTSLRVSIIGWRSPP